jgi:hypothetical protein
MHPDRAWASAATVAQICSGVSSTAAASGRSSSGGSRCLAVGRADHTLELWQVGNGPIGPVKGWGQGELEEDGLAGQTQAQEDGTANLTRIGCPESFSVHLTSRHQFTSDICEIAVVPDPGQSVMVDDSDNMPMPPSLRATLSNRRQRMRLVLRAALRPFMGGVRP